MRVKLVFQPRKQESHAWTILEVIIQYNKEKVDVNIVPST